jgi:hypothetical protein
VFSRSWTVRQFRSQAIPLAFHFPNDACVPVCCETFQPRPTCWRCPRLAKVRITRVLGKGSFRCVYAPQNFRFGCKASLCSTAVTLCSSRGCIIRSLALSVLCWTDRKAWHRWEWGKITTEFYGDFEEIFKCFLLLLSDLDFDKEIHVFTSVLKKELWVLPTPSSIESFIKLPNDYHKTISLAEPVKNGMGVEF